MHNCSKTINTNDMVVAGGGAKLSLLCSGIVVGCLLLANTASATSIWKGASGTHGAADWSAEDNWDGGVPTGDATAVVKCVNNERPRVVLTPPGSFTGTLILSNGVEATSWEMAMRTVLSNDVNSVWTVTGPGWLEATPGIAPRIGETFTGVLEIPKGVSLTLPATLNTSVDVVGAGEVTLANESQLDQVMGFAGVVKIAGAMCAPTDIAQIMNRSVELADGQTLSLSENMLALSGVHKVPGLEQPSDWKIVGKTWKEGRPGLPYSNVLPVPAADGTLKIVDDPAQTRVALYKGYRMKLQDSWGVSFTHIPELPLDSRFAQAGINQLWSGYFGFGMVAEFDPTLPDTGPYSSGFCGYSGYYYRSSGNQRYQFCQFGNWNSGIDETVLDGILMTKPIDVTMTCINGHYTITLVQGEKSCVIRRDIRTVMKDRGAGMWLAFVACSDAWGDDWDTIPWSTHTIKNFRGWYRNRVNANWVTHKDAGNFVPVSTETWAVNTIDPKNHVTNDVTVIDDNGDFLVKKIASGYTGNFHSKRALSRDSRFLLSFDADVTEGDVGDSGGSFTFGVANWRDTEWMCTGRAGEWDARWAQGWCGYWNFWQHTVAKCLSLRNSIDNGNWRSDVTVSNANDTPIVRLGSSAHIDYIYDAKGSLYIGMTVTNKTTGAGYARDYRQTLTESRWAEFRNKVSGGLYLDFRAKSGDWGLFAMKVRNLALKEISSNANALIDSPVAVAAGASSTLKVGATDAASATPAAMFESVALGAGSQLSICPEAASVKVGIKSLTVKGAANLTVASDAGVRELAEVVLTGEPTDGALAVAGDVRFANTLTIVIPATWHKSRNVIAAIDMSKLVGSSPQLSSIRVATDEGLDVTERSAAKYRDGVLTFNFTRGFAVVIR